MRRSLCVVSLAGCIPPGPSAADAGPDAGAADAASPPDAGPALGCNPLTQVRDDGAPACGSADPSMPDLGCYLVSFDWSGVQTACLPAGTFGHREVVTFPIFTNSCLPGAVPMFRESGGSMQVMCIALCEPLRINNTEPDEARDGVEPYSCPEMPHGVGVAGPVARAIGPGERCQHLRFWEAVDLSTPPSPT